jgi:hypothetical protein
MKLIVGFLLGLLVDLEDGVYVLLRNKIEISGYEKIHGVK